MGRKAADPDAKAERGKKKPAKAREPKTKDAKSATAGQAERVILQYLQKQNRPYGANDIFNNLHGAVPKAKGEIHGKTYGKSTIYVARQDLDELPSQRTMDTMDDTIVELKERLQDAKDTNKQLAGTLGTLQASLSVEQLTAGIQEARVRIAAMDRKLGELRTGTAKVDPVEKAAVDRRFAEYQKLWKQRKKMCVGIMDMITENLGTKRAEFMEELGLEDD